MKKIQFKYLFLGGLVLILAGSTPAFSKNKNALKGSGKLETKSEIRNKMSDDSLDRVNEERRDRLGDGNFGDGYRDGNKGKHKGQYKNGNNGKHKGQYKNKNKHKGKGKR